MVPDISLVIRNLPVTSASLKRQRRDGKRTSLFGKLPIRSPAHLAAGHCLAPRLEGTISDPINDLTDRGGVPNHRMWNQAVGQPVTLGLNSSHPESTTLASQRLRPFALLVPVRRVCILSAKSPANGLLTVWSRQMIVETCDLSCIELYREGLLYT